MKTQRWIDLSAQDIYLGSVTMADGISRLSLIDMGNSTSRDRMRDIGFLPFEGSPRFEQGIYYLDGDQALRPSLLAAALGLEKVPLVDVDPAEIEAVFRVKCQEKFQANLNAVTRRAEVLGQNALGQFVYMGPTGRFIRTSASEVMVERSSEGDEQGRAHFLRADSEGELRQCALGFIRPMLGGAKATWPDVVKFAEVVYGHEASDAELHRLQEAIEAAAYSVFAARAASLSPELAYRAAVDFYYGLPNANMRTAESIALHQLSSPLPLAVVGQRLLIGSDDLTGKTVLEPTVGNGSLVNMMPAGAQVFGLELDQKRVDAVSSERIVVEQGDATSVPLRALFGQPEGFDYTIANPPFGGLEGVHSFDKLKNVRRMDYFIGLRALAARKDAGRSVLIFGSDTKYSHGQVEKSATAFLNYLYDHYDVRGLVELDGRLYSRQGSTYNVRMIVIGDKLAVPRVADVPKTLPVLGTYEELWSWSEKVIAQYGVPLALTAHAPKKIEPVAEPVEVAPVVTGADIHADADKLPVAVTDVAQTSAPETWLVLNAPRPLLGMEVKENGDFLNGRFYAAIDPADSMAARFLEENRKLAASVVLVASRDEQVAMALLRSEYRDTYYAEMSADERYAALSAQIARLNEKTFGEAKELLEQARSFLLEVPAVEVVEVSAEIDITAIDLTAAPAFTTQSNPAAVVAAKGPAVVRSVNEFQTPYQPASQVGQPSSMVPINMAGATYAALNALEAREGSVDDFVATKLRYSKDELGTYFSPEQVDALALAIQAVESGRGIINADETGMGKGRFVAAMMRYARLEGKTPHFLTIKPELFTDIFRDIEDIGSGELFKKVFIFNDGVNIMRFGTEDQVLHRATSAQDRRLALANMEIDRDGDVAADMVLATYSQFQRAAHVNLKAQLLVAISSGNAMLFLDESHVAAGASNIAATVGEAVANSGGVVYSSATPLKGVANFAIYNKVFPASVNLRDLPETLRAGGEALQEAISANMARDGVLVRREHDFSKLTFVTRLPDDTRQALNIHMANKLSEILGTLSYMAGDVSKMVGKMNKSFEAEWEEIPFGDREGSRMRASSMNFGSRLYAINRQFLLGIKIEEAVAVALEDLENGRKPVIAVENTGESLLRQVLARRAGVAPMQEELDDLDERMGTLSDADRLRRDEVHAAIGQAMRNVRLDGPPQFRELLEIMLERIGEIKVQGRYGDVSKKVPVSEEYKNAEARALAMIKEFPDLPLTPLDVIRDEMTKRGFPITEVSGRTSSIAKVEDVWAATFHPKSDAVASVAGFQNGKFDVIIITRSGSTGISLHATNRFADSDTRQRNFIVLQKASNIAEFLQWLGRVNRKDQIIPPIITSLDSGLPAELRLTMMHNAKLRKLSANTTSNRENANTTGEDHDLLNDVGDDVALNWLLENPDVAHSLDIDLPSGEDIMLSRFGPECQYINKLLGRLMMVDVDKQREILDTLSRRFTDRIVELEQRGENPFKVDVFEWGARKVHEEELQSGVLHPTGSTFDEAVKLVSLEYERDVKPIRSGKLVTMIREGLAEYREFGPLDKDGELSSYKSALATLTEEALRKQLPMKLRENAGSVATLMADNPKDVAAAQRA